LKKHTTTKRKRRRERKERRKDRNNLKPGAAKFNERRLGKYEGIFFKAAPGFTFFERMRKIE